MAFLKNDNTLRLIEIDEDAAGERVMSGGRNNGRQQDLLEIVNRVYEIDDLEQMGSALFGVLRRLIRLSSGVLLPVDPDKFEIRKAHYFACSTKVEALPYLERYAALDPLLRRDPATLILNRSVRLSEVADSTALASSEFAEFMGEIPYRHALGVVCGYKGEPLAVLILHRRQSDTDFSLADMVLVDRIAPHLGNALALREWRDEAKPREKSALLAFGENRLLFTNQAAKGLLSTASAASVLAVLPPGGVGVLQLDDRAYRVRRLPWRAASLLTGLACRESPAATSADSAPKGSGGNDWACIQRFGGRLTIVTVSPFRRRIDVHKRLERYGLSRREREIAWYSIRSGLGTVGLARSLCISTNTVKSHFREVYRKTGVNSQRELVLKITGGESHLSPPDNVGVLS